MLKNFLYLDLAALDNYLGAHEDGIATRIERQSGKNAGVGGSVGASGAKLSSETSLVSLSAFVPTFSLVGDAELARARKPPPAVR